MNCLEAYLKIFELYPLHDLKCRKKRGFALHNWRVNQNDYSLLSNEACKFIRENPAIITSVFIIRAICPLINDCLNKNKSDFINELLNTIDMVDSPKITVEDIINSYCEYIQREKSQIEIVNELLLHSDSILLLKYKFNLMQTQIDFSIHELPIGILKEDIGISTRQNYIEYFSKFEEIAKMLNEKADLDRVKIVYEAYFDYLDNKNEYSSFEEYLDKNNIDYKCLI